MKTGFNINALLGNIPAAAKNGAAAGETKSRPMLKVIPISINDLIPSADNFYSVDNIAELKTSIEMFGVVQPLAVKPLEGGKYRIIAGHRRHAACTELVNEGKREYEYVLCGIQTERDEIKERILMIMTNSTTRELSDWEKMKQAEELHKHFAILKKRDNLPGRVRDLVAEALNTSSTQIARMDAIAKNLIPELADEFKGGGLGLSAAYELSGAAEETQKQAHTEYQEKGGLFLNDVRAIKEKADADLMRDIEQGEQKAREELKNAGSAPPAPAPKPQMDYPETPDDTEEEQDAPEERNFADMSAGEKAEAAAAFLNAKRFMLFSPGSDTRIFDFILEAVEHYGVEGVNQ